MSNVSYDLDTSGGLMPLIRALIKPPDEDLNVPKPKKPQHPYYKRPGKGHNHDSCDACGEGGDLICCDRCPASFHLGCYDPPLEESDIPAGLWLCRECAAADADRAPSSRGSRAHSPVDTKPEGDKKTRSLRNRANSTKKTSKDGKEKSEEKEKEPQEKEKELTPMEALVKAARIMNPKQFELPSDMKISCLFPGTDKESNGAECPPGARTCHACDRTCRAAPLIQCDYCPLLFHQDCLDPPLTALPTGRWMCPNHVEQYIDWKLVSSVSCSERAALWARWGAAVEPRTAVADFLRRAKTRNPRFRMKVCAAGARRVCVPGAVTAHYARPPPLQPARRDHVRCSRRDLTDPTADPTADPPARPAPVCVNLQCPRGAGGECPHGAEAARLEEEERRDAAEARSSSDTDSDFEQLAAPGRAARDEAAGAPSRERVLRAVQRRLRALDGGLVALLAWQRLQQLAAGEARRGRWQRCPLADGVEALLARSLDRRRLAALLPRRAALPSDLLGAAERERIARVVWGPPPAAPAPPPPRPALPLCPARALLAPLEPAPSGAGLVLGRAVPMRLSRLWVGSGADCDVILPADTCRRLSARHAVIYLDEVTGHFELLNYSEWGTRVNNVLYASEPARIPESHTPPPAELTDLIKDKMPNIELSWEGAPACSCRYLSSGGGAWEGAALLPHGALLHFGCRPYVFCRADLAEPDAPYV